jgi:hypothetical protein
VSRHVLPKTRANAVAGQTGNARRSPLAPAPVTRWPQVHGRVAAIMLVFFWISMDTLGWLMAA